MAVVQLRVNPNGRTYSTSADQETRCETVQETSGNHNAVGENEEKAHGSEKRTRDSQEENLLGEDAGRKVENGVVLPLSKKHVELFTEMSARPIKTTVRTDTVSTILEQEFELDYDRHEYAGNKLIYLLKQH